MAKLINEWCLDEFEMRLYKETDGSACITLVAISNRVQCLEYDSVEDARPVYKTMCEVIRDVLAVVNDR